MDMIDPTLLVSVALAVVVGGWIDRILTSIWHNIRGQGK